MSRAKIPENLLPIHSDSKIMSGVPIFVGTRVPGQILFDYFMDGSSVDEFLEKFPTVSREHVMQLLEFALLLVLEEVVSR
ncbi:MAG TPA: DUF433 domain-containing protein [Thermodesulfobacteriota bacterium]|nr:DUF433 domain-containing protein [Thermodesulfobacteriota bacterium]